MKIRGIRASSLYTVSFSGIMIVPARSEDEAVDKFFTENTFRDGMSLDITEIKEVLNPRELIEE